MPVAEVICGDVAEVAREMRANSFDGCLCDPPYALTDARPANSATPRRSSREAIRAGFMGQRWDSEIPGPEVWQEILRVLKPGAHLLAFGGTRTHHRLMCAIEDAGFEIRDCVMWLYGSGFPKSLDVSKAIDKESGATRTVLGYRDDGVGSDSGSGCYQMNSGNSKLTRTVPITAPATPEAVRWSGYGTALKPAFEPVLLCMKPCEGTFADNALRWGVAGLAIDAGRIPCEAEANLKGGFTSSRAEGWDRPWKHDPEKWIAAKERGLQNAAHAETLGRWPANLILDEEAAAMLDAQTGVLTSGKMKASTPRANRSGYSGPLLERTNEDTYGDSGGASRFFYVAKSSRSERGEGNNHPTVKPLKLCEYLARLILPPVRESDPRRILVPFSGSGSEMIGALAAGWDLVIGIENEPAYVRIAESRLRDRVPGIAPISLETLETILECA